MLISTLFQNLILCEFRSAARVWPSGHDWPYSGDQDLVTLVGPTVIVSVLPTLAANTGNQRYAPPSARLWPRLELTVGPTLANCFRWPWQFSRPTFGPRLNQSSAYYSRQWTNSVIISLVGPTSGQQGWTNFNKVGPTVGRWSIRTWDIWIHILIKGEDSCKWPKMNTIYLRL